jgi:photosystem II stability/assembly factor-like uncharacterized protein
METKMKSTFSFVAVLISIILLNSNIKSQWVDTGCPFGGYVYAIAVAEPIIFIGTDQAGVYRSTDSGVSWSQANSGLTITSVSSLAFSGSSLFAGTTYGGIFRSTDNGSNWTEVNTGLSVLFINTLALSGSNIYAGARHSVTGGGVFLSTNNGDNWSYIGLTDQEVYSLAISGNNIFAGTDGGVFVTTNNGVNWTAVNSGLNADLVYALEISDGNLYAGTSDGIFYSVDNGSNWTNISSALLDDKIIRSIALYSSNIIVGTGGYGAYLSTNNGISWEENDKGFPNSFSEIFALTISNTKIYAGTLFRGAWERPLTDYVTDVEIVSDNLPLSFNLAQNYPNPFNPSTVISYQLPRGGEVSLIVYDILSNEIITLVDEYKPAGRYEVEFNASKLTSGAYFYQLKTGDFLQTRKMILIK